MTLPPGIIRLSLHRSSQNRQHVSSSCRRMLSVRDWAHQAPAASLGINEVVCIRAVVLPVELHPVVRHRRTYFGHAGDRNDLSRDRV